jgi:hypothetical protein
MSRSPAEMARVLQDMRDGRPEVADPRIAAVAAELEESWPAEAAGAVTWERDTERTEAR